MPKDKLQLSVQPRTVLGKKVKTLRREGILPLSLYGRGLRSLSLLVKSEEFARAYQQVGASRVLNLKIEGEEKLRPVLIHQVQKDPLQNQFLHADFLQVSEAEKVEIAVPLRFLGEAPAVKAGKGVFLELLSEVEIEALPADLPAEIEVDISGLSEVNQALKAGNLPLPEGVSLKTNPESLICKIEKAAVEEEKPAEKPTAPAETSKQPSQTAASQ